MKKILDVLNREIDEDTVRMIDESSLIAVAIIVISLMLKMMWERERRQERWDKKIGYNERKRIIAYFL